MKYDLHVDLSGLGNSGKGIISDYLMEFNNVYVPRKDLEFNLLRAPGGLMDMHYSLVESWTPIRSDDAITRFIKLAHRLGSRVNFQSPKELFNAAGYRYEDFYPGFLKLTDEFIKDIITFSYKGLWPYRDYHSSTIDLLVKRIYSKLNKNAILENIYFSEGLNFNEKLNNYVYEVLNLALKEEYQIYVTHNAFEPFEIDRYLKIMEKSKLIIVKRDPRDLYTNISIGNRAKSGFYKQMKPTFYNLSAASNLNDFILYQKKMLGYLKNISNSNLLIVNFNDFICDYDLVSKKVNDFLELKAENHVSKHKYFNPKISIENVGIYKNFKDINSIQLIEKELSNYWDFDGETSSLMHE